MDFETVLTCAYIMAIMQLIHSRHDVFASFFYKKYHDSGWFKATYRKVSLDPGYDEEHGQQKIFCMGERPVLWG